MWVCMFVCVYEYKLVFIFVSECVGVFVCICMRATMYMSVYVFEYSCIYAL